MPTVQFAGQFLSTPSARRATPCNRHPRSNHQYFYPRPPRGGRPGPRPHNRQDCLFLSTPSARRATMVSSENHLQSRYFYPRPPRGGRPPAAFYFIFSAKISIHALREEGDRGFPVGFRRGGYFYPRPPRGGRPPCTVLPADTWDISIHALREEGDFGYPV